MKCTPAWVTIFPPWLSEGWTIHFIDRESRYWFEARAGLKDESLFEKSVKAAWDWAKPSSSIRWFTGGERRYSKVLWKLASAYLPRSTTTQAYPFRKVWRAGLEVAMKIKGSQGKPRVMWVNREHPYTAISPKSDVHANHLEALHSSLRRRASGYRRRQNHYAKTVEGLQRALNVQRLIHNWCRAHYSHGYQRTPAMVMGFIQRPVKIGEVLAVRAFKCLTS